ncbi:MAG: hypothetical protein K6E22_10340 [Treponema sp.]|nr:hypothetical protein [Treponema sp.]
MEEYKKWCLGGKVKVPVINCIDVYKFEFCRGCRSCHKTAKCNTHEPHAKLTYGKKIAGEKNTCI